MIRALLLGWLLLAGLLAAAGWSELPGQPAARTAGGWWMARQFDAAALADDLEGLARLGPALHDRIGDSLALGFTAQRLGFQITGSSYHLPPEEAAHWASLAIEMLEERLERLEQPWDARRIQADIIVNREAAARHRELGARASLEWFASGGGPDWPFGAPAAAFRAGLELPEEERGPFFLACLSALSEGAD